MAWFRRPSGQRDTFRREPGNGPARGRFLRIGHIGRGRRIDDVDPLMLGETAIVNVPVHVGFYVRTRREDFPEIFGVNESPWKVQPIAAQARVVMGHDNRRF